MLINKLIQLLRKPEHKQFARNSFVVAALQFVGTALVFFLQILLARVVADTTQYGVFVWGQSLLFMTGTLCTVGLPVIASRFIASLNAIENRQGARIVIRHAWTLLLITAPFLITGMWLATSFIGTPGGKGLSNQVIILAILAAPLASISMLYQAFSRAHRWFVLALLPARIVRPLVTALLAVGCWLVLNDNLSGVMVLVLTIASLCVIVLVQIAIFHYRVGRIQLKEIAAKTNDMLHRATLFKASFQVFLAQISSLIIQHSSILFLGILAGPAAAGIYFAAERLARFSAMPLKIAQSVSTPTFAEAHMIGDRTRLQRAATQAAHGSLWPTLMIAVATILLGPWVLSLFGKDYDQATTALGLLLFGQVVNVAVGPTTELLNMTGHHKVVTLMSTVTAGIHLMLVSTLIPMFGVTGAAIAGTASLVISNLCFYYLVRKRLQINPAVLGN